MDDVGMSLASLTKQFETVFSDSRDLVPEASGKFGSSCTMSGIKMVVDSLTVVE